MRNCRTFRFTVSFRAMRRDTVSALRSGALVLILGGCARAATVAPPATTPTVEVPVDSARMLEPLPPIPLVDGPLAVRVVYPTPGALITSRDSNFIFGSVGSGNAALDINGTPVKVHPNGAFLGFLANPLPANPQYLLRVTRGTDSATLVHPVRILPPEPSLAETGPLVVDSASVRPRTPMRLPPDETVRVSVRAPVNASVRLVWPGGSRPLESGNVEADSAQGVYALPGRDPWGWTTEVPASVLARSPALVVTRGVDTVRLPLAAAELDTATTPSLVLLGIGRVGPGGAPVVGRSVPDPAGTSRWFLHPGTVVRQTGRIGGYTRVRLDEQLDIWVENADVTPLRAGITAPQVTILSARIAPAAEWVDLILTTRESVPFLVEEHPKSLVLTMYGVKSSVDVIRFEQNDSLVRTVLATQVSNGRAQFTVNLDAAPFGYEALWDMGRFILRIRRPPVVDARAPLRGLTIAVDPGHPPIGATGPTGLYEGDAVLPIGERMKRLLEERGATVFMTRTSREPVALAERPIMARQANAHAFVSIHLNAYPDGVNPMTSLNTGTGTYYYHPHSERLARAVQSALLPELRLRNVGVFQQSFAVIRNSWMPAVLAEGAFLMIPEQEAALRTPEYQEAYARGLVAGLEGFFRTLAR